MTIAQLFFDPALQADAVSLTLDIVAKATVLMLLALVISQFMKRASAASRHCLWSVSLVSILMLPILAVSIPKWHVWPVRPTESVFETNEDASLHGQLSSGVSEGANLTDKDDNLAGMPLLTTDSGSQAPAQSTGPNSAFVQSRSPVRAELLLAIAIGIWTVGFVVSLTPILVGLVRLSRAAGRRGNGPEDSLQQLVHELANEIRVQTPRVIQGPQFAMPMVWGLTAGRLMLPPDAEQWPQQKLRQVVLHELAHLKRKDPVTLLLGRLACAFYWFHPLTHFCFHRLKTESENASDDFVLQMGHPSTDYAELLLQISTQRQFPLASHVTVAMAQRLKIERRIRNILDRQQNRNPLSAKALIVGLLLSLGATSVMACLSTNADPAQESDLTTAIDPPAVTARPPEQYRHPLPNPVRHEAQPVGQGDEIEAALKRAVKSLESLQQADGGWKQRGPSYNTNTLATLALIRAGNLADTKAKQAALRAMGKLDAKGIYTISLQTIALAESGDQVYRKTVIDNIKSLCKRQINKGRHTGGWSYGMLPAQAETRGDGSNTRFAIWALTIAHQAGFEVPQINLHRAAEYWLNSQEKGGGWGYVVSGPPTVNMTLSGIASLAMIKRCLDNDAQLHKKIDAAIVRAWRWKGIEAKLKSNKGHQIYGWQIYMLACQSTDWKTDNISPQPETPRQKAFESLKKLQSANGDFKTAGHEQAPDVANGLAILALSPEPE